jgi:hypothetical protein
MKGKEDTGLIVEVRRIGSRRHMRGGRWAGMIVMEEGRDGGARSKRAAGRVLSEG